MRLTHCIHCIQCVSEFLVFVERADGTDPQPFFYLLWLQNQFTTTQMEWMNNRAGHCWQLDDTISLCGVQDTICVPIKELHYSVHKTIRILMNLKKKILKRFLKLSSFTILNMLRRLSLVLRRDTYGIKSWVKQPHYNILLKCVYCLSITILPWYDTCIIKCSIYCRYNILSNALISYAQNCKAS